MSETHEIWCRSSRADAVVHQLERDKVWAHRETMALSTIAKADPARLFTIRSSVGSWFHSPQCNVGGSTVDNTYVMEMQST